jgi:hypothetical protein
MPEALGLIPSTEKKKKKRKKRKILSFLETLRDKICKRLAWGLKFDTSKKVCCF